MYHQPSYHPIHKYNITLYSNKDKGVSFDYNIDNILNSIYLLQKLNFSI